MAAGRRRRPLTKCRCGCPGRLRHSLVFVLGTGRSGSTSLLWFLNSLPDAHFVGENAGVGNLLVELANAAVQTERRSHLTAWHNPTLNSARFQCNLVRTLLDLVDPPPSARIIGFKSIRIVESAERLAALFPCARFIVNVRDDVQAQSRSSFYGLQSHTPERASLPNRTAALLEFAAQQPDRRYVLPTEQITVAGLQELLRWLAPLDALAPTGPLSSPQLRFDHLAHSPCPTLFDRRALRVIPPDDPCARCPQRADARADAVESGGAVLPYGNCTVLRAPRVDGVATHDELAKWQPLDARHEGIVSCSPSRGALEVTAASER